MTTPAMRVAVLVPCFNEEANVREVYQQVKAAMATLPGYEYDHLFIDNASTDGTVAILREIAAADQQVIAFFRIDCHALLVSS